MVNMSCPSTEGASSPSPLPPDPVYTFRPYAGEVTAVQYVTLPERKAAIASGTTKGQLGIWDLASKRQIWTNEGNDQIMSIKFLHRSSKLLSQCRRGCVDMWDLETKIKDCSISIGNPGFCRLAMAMASTLDDGVSQSLSPGCFAVGHSENGKVNLFDIQVQSHVSTFLAKSPKSTGMCMSVASHCDTESGRVYFVGGFEDGSVLVWDTRKTNEELASVKLFSEPVLCMDFSSLQSCGIAGSPSKQLEAFSLSVKEGKLEKKYSIELKNAGVADVAIRHDCKIFTSGGWDVESHKNEHNALRHSLDLLSFLKRLSSSQRIRVFGFKKGKPLAILNYHSTTVNSTVFAGASAPPEDSNFLLCGSKDKRISLWRLY